MAIEIAYAPLSLVAVEQMKKTDSLKIPVSLEMSIQHIKILFLQP